MIRLTGAFMGVLSLVSGFFTETLMIIVSAVCYSVWKVCENVSYVHVIIIISNLQRYKTTCINLNATSESTLIKLDELSDTESDDPEQQTGLVVL